MKLIKDEFDTQVLGQNVYKLFLDYSTKPNDIHNALTGVRGDIIFCFTPVDSENIIVLESLRFHLVSTRATYVYTGDTPVLDTPLRSYTISPFDPSSPFDEKDVYLLAKNIYEFSRYKKDSQIDPDKSIEIYLQWIKNSLFNGYAQQCFLAWQKNTAIGICTVKIVGNRGYIDLLGVLPEHQGKNIGKQLLHRALAYLQAVKIASIYVTTEAENIPANIFYQKNNFVIQKFELVYHKHTSL